MAKVLLCLFNISLENLFLLFLSFDFLMYALIIYRSIFIIVDAGNGVHLSQHIGASLSVVIGVVIILVNCVYIYWGVHQLRRFIKARVLYEESQLRFFIFKIVNGLPMIVFPFITFLVNRENLLFKLGSVFINFMQISWALQIYLSIRRHLSEYRKSKSDEYLSIVNSVTDSKTQSIIAPFNEQ